MVTLSLSGSRVFEPSANGARTLSRLGLGRSTKARVDVANRFLVNALNRKSGKRFVDASRAFLSVRHALGASLEWITECPVSDRYLEAIAESVNSNLAGYFDCGDEDGVHVMIAEWSCGGVRLVPAADSEKDAMEDSTRLTLLIPTGIKSRKIDDEFVYLRIDGWMTHDGQSDFIATDVLFTDEDGKCLVGFGAITEFITNLDNVPLAIEHAVGGDYDVRSLNAAVFDAWWQHRLSDPNGDTILIPTIETDAYGRPITLVMEREGTNTWSVSVEIDGDRFSPSELIPGMGVEIDAVDVMNERERLVREFQKCDHPGWWINYVHIFDENFGRFPEEVKQAITADPDGMFAKFTDELGREIQHLRQDPLAWSTTMFNKGAEKELECDGDKIATRIQLLAPVRLTDADRKVDRPTVYVVAALKLDKETGIEHVSFPTILDNRMVQTNRNIMRRAVRNALGKAA